MTDLLDDALAAQLGRPLYDAINKHLADGQRAEAAIARVRRLCELTIAASVRVQAIDQARDTLATLDDPADTMAPAPCRTTQHCAYHGWCRRCAPDFAATMSRINVAIQRTDGDESHWGPLYEAIGKALNYGEQSPRTTPDNPPTSSDTPDNLRRLRAQLAAERDKARRADEHPRPDLDHLRVTPHNGIAAGLEIAMHGVDCMLGGPQLAHDAGPTVAECSQDDRVWTLQREGE